MYKLLLILKYLRKRRIAWVSLVAVMLCTTMVLVVISVMGGWLRAFRSQYHGLSGDVLIEGRSLVGFPHYEEIIKRITKDVPEVKAAVPAIRTFGLININNVIRRGVSVVGYPPDIQEVNAFRASAHRIGGNVAGVLVGHDCAAELLKQPDPEKAAAESACAKDAAKHEAFGVISGKAYYPFDSHGNRLAKAYAASKEFTPRVRVRADEKDEALFVKDGKILPTAITSADALHFKLWPDETYRPPPAYTGDVRSWPGMIVGTGVVNMKRDKRGVMNRPVGLYDAIADLTLLPLSPDSAKVDATGTTRTFYWIIDDSRTGVHLVDSSTVYVPFAQLQKDLEMDAFDDRPARVSEIQVSLKPGADPNAARDKIRAIVDAVMLENKLSSRFPYRVETWEEIHATFIAAIENEKGLVTILFGLISVVAVFLIFCIFYMIVAEKTRDIGIIKSVGATSAGVAGVFLGYGLAIGLVGAGLGFTLAWLIVRYINEMHTFLGEHLGIVVWNPEVYLFDNIPNTMNPNEVVVILAVAVVASVLGSLVPAYRAARLNPVEALRWE